ncbi:hypothetical protein [Reyranella sp.]|uniref:hypothetical protein n=1 Tax=Reyranella sp. TaxID=1929291 RepID=UPI00403679B5
MPVDRLRPDALAMNIVVASCTTWRLHALGLIDGHRLLALAVASLPAAFVGGLIALPAGLYAAMIRGVLMAPALIVLGWATRSRVSPARCWRASSLRRNSRSMPPSRFWGRRSPSSSRNAFPTARSAWSKEESYRSRGYDFLSR